jgi:hypothetical protein
MPKDKKGKREQKQAFHQELMLDIYILPQTIAARLLVAEAA